MADKSIYHRHPVVTQPDRYSFLVIIDDVHTGQRVCGVSVNQGF